MDGAIRSDRARPWFKVIWRFSTAALALSAAADFGEG
jgi:hypothetical protein